MLPSANPAVIFQKLDDGAVLFTPETELYFGLNSVGALVWDLLPPRTETLDLLPVSTPCVALWAGRRVGAMSTDTKQSAPRRTRDRNRLELVTERPLGMDLMERDARTRKILGRGRCGGGWTEYVRCDRSCC